MERNRLKLAKPAMKYQAAYYEFFQEYQVSGEPFIPWVIKFDPDPFDGFIKTLQDMEDGLDLPSGYVPGSTFWLVEDDERIIGVVNIRHRLTESLRKEGGHIGYGIRPTERNKGYGTIILKLALEEAKKLGIRKALLTCSKDNIASAKVIINNKGVLDSEDIVGKRALQRYWISLDE
jgi:predicted acetyltransferase